MKESAKTIVSKCLRCGQCCHAFGITLSLADMNREPRLWQVAVPIHKVGNPRIRAYMAEKKMPFAIGKPYKGAACPFLDADNSCMIYETRPQICRDYPQSSKCIRQMQKLVGVGG
jgi:Fe-S-cluster containining protein